jgi:hypothetical protein
VPSLCACLIARAAEDTIYAHNFIDAVRLRESGSFPVEILHVDTVNSRQLCRDMNDIQKADAVKFLKAEFNTACTKYGGHVHSSSWAGDGGYGVFYSTTAKQQCASIRAGKHFLDRLPELNAQTAGYLKISRFYRKVRIAAHRAADVYLANSADLDSAKPEFFDDFFKFVKKFSPIPNNLFITSELHHVLPQDQKHREFRLFKKNVVAGALHTKLYRLRRIKNLSTTDEFLRRRNEQIAHGDKVLQLTPSDWMYLRRQIYNHTLNVSARNQITKGVIRYLDSRKNQKLKSSTALLNLTLDALFLYLKNAFLRHRIRVSYWRAIRKRGIDRLAMLAYRYPDGESTDMAQRVVDASHTQYKICEAFSTGESIATPSVTTARIQGQWQDFDRSQSIRKRALMSALQIPVYYQRNGRLQKIGVLSFDADAPDVFLAEEKSMWSNELVGFLANLALAEKLHEKGG